jgi:hypothetical protein
MKKKKLKGAFSSKSEAIAAMKKLPKKYYTHIEPFKDGSFDVIYSDPGEGVGW